MKRLVIGLIVFVWFINGCTSVNQITPIPIVDSATTTSSPFPTATATQTSIPSATPTATITPLPTIPTFTPTFDVRTIVTVTPVPKAECPKVDTTNSAKIFSDERGLSNTEIAEKILDLLNQGIPKSRINHELTNSLTSWGAYYEPMREKDLTNDGVSELIAQIGNGFAIYKCKMGKYEMSLSLIDDFGVDFSQIMSTQDMNLDGMPEVVTSISACSGYGCLGMRIHEWNGLEFQNLIRAPIYDSSTGKIITVSESAGIDAPKSVEIIDLNGNGTLELVITGGYSPWELPTWRYETYVYEWDGLAFVLAYKEFADPEYLFQAIQDADTAVLVGNYDKAMNLYQNGISSQELEWWSVERQEH